MSRVKFDPWWDTASDSEQAYFSRKQKEEEYHRRNMMMQQQMEQCQNPHLQGIANPALQQISQLDLARNRDDIVEMKKEVKKAQSKPLNKMLLLLENVA